MTHPEGGYEPSHGRIPPGADFIDAPPGTMTAETWPPPGTFPDEGTSYPPHAAAWDTAEQPLVVPHDVTEVLPITESGPSQWGQSQWGQNPWHAQHEAPGQWEHPPPEHLAWQHSPPAEVPGRPEPIWSGAPQHPPAWPDIAPAESPKRRRGGVVIAFALAATLLLCGGGAASAYFLLRDADNPGSPDPSSAVDRFLNAVYTQQNANTAEQYVCREARNKTQISERVDQIKTYASGYPSPVFHWDDPTVSAQDKQRATVSATVTMTTGDEKSAQQPLKFTVVHKTGWLVCDITG